MGAEVRAVASSLAREGAMVEDALIVIAPVICLARLAGLSLVQRRHAEKLDLGEGHRTSQAIARIAIARGPNPPWLIGRTTARMP